MKNKYYNYKPLYDDGMYEGKKRGRKTKEEKKKYIEDQKLKVVYKVTILRFD